MKEYQALKDEQLKRIVARDHVIYLNIGAVGLAFSMVIKDGSPEGLLIVPWICLMMGWLHIINDQKIIDIAKYFIRTLEPNLKKELKLEENQVLEWETFGKTGKKNWPMRWLYFLIKLAAFFLPGFGALCWYIYRYCADKPTIFIVAAWLSGMLLLWEVLYLDRYLSLRNAGGKNERDQQ
jgi:hypothetical protein